MQVRVFRNSPSAQGGLLVGGGQTLCDWGSSVTFRICLPPMPPGTPLYVEGWYKPASSEPERPCPAIGSIPTFSPCRADVNCSGGVSVQDVFDFVGYYFSADPRANFNGVGGISVQDLFDFLAAYFTPCP